jgi:hypothetical protein
MKRRLGSHKDVYLSFSYAYIILMLMFDQLTITDDRIMIGDRFVGMTPSNGQLQRYGSIKHD